MIPYFRAALQYDEKLVRWEAVDALGEVGPAAIREAPAVRRALKDEFSGVRCSSAVALWKIGGETAAAIPVLLAELKQDMNSLCLFSMALHAIEEIGPAAKAAAPTLRRLAPKAEPQAFRKQLLHTLAKIDPE